MPEQTERTLMIDRIMKFSSPKSGPFNGFRLWEKKGQFYGFTREDFEQMTNERLVNAFENVVAAAYRQQ